MPVSFETLTLDGLKLPDYFTLTELIGPNLAKNEALDGSTYVAFFNKRRAWQISWDTLAISDYDTIRAKYDKQFNSQIMLPFIINGKRGDLYSQVYMSINDKNIRFSGNYVEGFSITLQEQAAIS